MKIFHLSDLHIGKQTAGYDMEEDLQFVFRQIVEYMDIEKPDVVIIAGDIYDKPIPSARSVGIFDELLFEMSKRDVSIMVISGNHDSAERMAFGSRIMEKANVHIKGAYKGSCDRITLQDEYGPVNFYLMPFVRPIDVRQYHDLEERETADYGWAVGCLTEEMHIDTSQRNVLVAHQNVTDSGKNSRTESEVVTIGMVDNVDVKYLDDFDYAALGHLHRPQSVGRPEVRYCGTPMAYSMSEAKDEKSITCIEMMEKDDIHIRTLPLKQLRSWVDFEGTMEEAMKAPKNDNYTRFMLTDDETVIDAVPRLRNIYGRIIEVRFLLEADSYGDETEQVLSRMEEKDTMEIFEDFYAIRHDGREMSDCKKQYIREVIKETEEGQ